MARSYEWWPTQAQQTRNFSDETVGVAAARLYLVCPPDSRSLLPAVGSPHERCNHQMFRRRALCGHPLAARWHATRSSPPAPTGMLHDRKRAAHSRTQFRIGGPAVPALKRVAPCLLRHATYELRDKVAQAVASRAKVAYARNLAANGAAAAGRGEPRVDARRVLGPLPSLPAPTRWARLRVLVANPDGDPPRVVPRLLQHHQHC